MPQLQTSYVKTLNDKQSLRNIRLLAVEGLKEISPFVSRLDNLIIELHNGIKKNDDTSVRYAYINRSYNLYHCVYMYYNNINSNNKYYVTMLSACDKNLLYQLRPRNKNPFTT